MTPQIKQRIEQIRSGEVPEGYKRTRAGIIPSDWFLHPLTQHLTESRITGTNGAVAKKLTVKLWNKGVLEKREVHEGSESTTYYKRKAGQLIYSKLDFLNCAFGIIPQQLDGYESTQDLPCFDINGVDPCYLLTYLTQRNFYTHFGMIADGGRKARRIGPKDMLSFPLVYPPLSEQKKIAEILQTQDKLIELQQKKIEELKKLKKAYLSKMFPKKGCNVPEIRFPGFTDPWEQRKLGEIGSVSMCRRIFKEQTSETGDIPFYKIGTFGAEPDAFISRELFEEYKSKYPYPQKGDILISASGSIGRTVEFAGNNEYFQDSNIVWLKHDERLSNPFLKCFYSVVKWAGIEGSTIKRLYNDNILNTVICMPSVPEQERIGVFFENLDHLITLHQRKLEEMKIYKKSLMQLLLTGIVRTKGENECLSHQNR